MWHIITTPNFTKTRNHHHNHIVRKTQNKLTQLNNKTPTTNPTKQITNPLHILILDDISNLPTHHHIHSARIQQPLEHLKITIASLPDIITEITITETHLRIITKGTITNTPLKDYTNIEHHIKEAHTKLLSLY